MPLTFPEVEPDSDKGDVDNSTVPNFEFDTSEGSLNGSDDESSPDPDDWDDDASSHSSSPAQDRRKSGGTATTSKSKTKKQKRKVRVLPDCPIKYLISHFPINCNRLLKRLPLALRINPRPRSPALKRTKTRTSVMLW
jgi:hypothetical protein